jgi:hypothetical protein
MISYADFEFAISRWKSRAAGVSPPPPPPASGVVDSEVPAAPEATAGGAEQESGAVVDEVQNTVSGTIVNNDLLETPGPDSDPQ